MACGPRLWQDSAFARAAHPERIFVGAVEQYDENDDFGCLGGSKVPFKLSLSAYELCS